MQTFVPFDAFEKSAKVLDTKRLNKQVVETKQILLTLRKIEKRDKLQSDWEAAERGERPYPVIPKGAKGTGRKPPEHEKIGWEHHPAVLMWSENVGALRKYGRVMLAEARRRGSQFDNDKFKLFGAGLNTDPRLPHWWGGDIHYTHRVKLCEKNWGYYNGRFLDVFDTDVGELDYFWPAPLIKQEPVPTLDDWAVGHTKYKRLGSVVGDVLGSALGMSVTTTEDVRLRRITLEVRHPLTGERLSYQTDRKEFQLREKDILQHFVKKVSDWKREQDNLAAPINSTASTATEAQIRQAEHERLMQERLLAGREKFEERYFSTNHIFDGTKKFPPLKDD